MQKIINMLEGPLSKFANYIGDNKLLMSIKDSFIFTLPFVIISSILQAINWMIVFNLQIENEFVLGIADKLGYIAGHMQGIQGVLVVIAAAYFYSEKFKDVKNFNVVTSTLVALVSYFILVPYTIGEGDAMVGGIAISFINYEAVFIGLIVSLFTVRLYSILINKVPTIKLPEQVPPSIFNSFFALIPVTIIVVGFEVLNLIINAVGYSSAHELVNTLILIPLQSMGTGLVAMLVVMLVMQLLWFFGLHGFSIVWGIVGSVWIPFFLGQIDTFTQTGSAQVFIDSPSPNVMALIYGMIGGSGSTLALVLVIFLLAGKDSFYRSIAKVAIVPSLFNINEPVIFGMPIVLNPMLFLPFVFTPLINIVIAYVAHAQGLVSPLIMAGSGAEPVFFNVFVGSGGKLSPVVLYLVLLLIDMVIWAPFAQILLKQEKAENNAKTA
ncbi:PTS transporter subunit EIIC [Mollicutes bacterium LVI A0039]|nr:PTS transporter subunit EIIC [Mollicutes bacterium LVI A0039]